MTRIFSSLWWGNIPTHTWQRVSRHPADQGEVGYPDTQGVRCFVFSSEEQRGCCLSSVFWCLPLKGCNAWEMPGSFQDLQVLAMRLNQITHGYLTPVPTLFPHLAERGLFGAKPALERWKQLLDGGRSWVVVALLRFSQGECRGREKVGEWWEVCWELTKAFKVRVMLEGVRRQKVPAAWQKKYHYSLLKNTPDAWYSHGCSSEIFFSKAPSLPTLLFSGVQAKICELLFKQIDHESH